MPKSEKPTAPIAGLPSRSILGSESWENEGGAMRTVPKLAAAVEQPRLYADLLAEADRRRRIADRVIVQGLVAPRGH